MKLIDWPLWVKVLLMFLLSGLQVYVIHVSSIIYIAQFFMIGISFFGGMWVPKKGYWLAIAQTICILVGHWVYVKAGWPIPYPDLAEFGTYISFFSTFVGSFLGAFIRKM